MLMRRDAQGRLLLSDAIAALGERIDAGLPERVDAADLVQASKDLFLFALGTVLDKHGDTLMEKQDLLGRLTDLAIGSFAMESVWARAEKARRKDSGSAGGVKEQLSRPIVYETIERLGLIAGQVIAAVAAGDNLARLRGRLFELVKYTPIDGISLNREIAARICEAGKYIA